MTSKIGIIAQAAGKHLAAAWNISTAVFLRSKDISAQEAGANGVFFRSDGLKMYVVGLVGDKVYEYDLSVAWDVTSAAFLQSKSILAQDTQSSGLFFRSDGLKMYITGTTNDRVYEYDLSAAWDVTSAAFLRSVAISVGDPNTNPYGVFFRADGLKMYVLGNNFVVVYEYDLASAWNVTTAVFLRSKSIIAQGDIPKGVFLRADGLKMYTCTDNFPPNVNEYDLSVAWDVTSAAFLQSKSVLAEDTIPSHAFFRSDGLKMYVCGEGLDKIYEYNVG